MDHVHELAERVHRLERQNRRLLFAFLSLAALGVGLLVEAAKAAPKNVIVEANQFILKDAAGNVKGQFLIGPDGGGAMVLFGPDGKLVTHLPLQPGAFPLRQ